MYSYIYYFIAANRRINSSIHILVVAKQYINVIELAMNYVLQR